MNNSTSILMRFAMLTLALLAPASNASAKGTQPATRPNILFIMVDDLGKEWVECYGGKKGMTPTIDALARGGMLFHNAYSMPQCTPTRATLLTGQYPWRNGWVNHWDVPRWGAGCHFDWKYNYSVARAMRAAGYKTAIAGKWQINDFRVQPDALDHHGFDDWCMWTGGEGHNPKSNQRYFKPYIHTKDDSRTYEDKFGPDMFTNFLIDFMTKHRDEPMFLYFPMALTHGPLTTTPDEPDAKGWQRFDAMVRYTDKCVKRLLDTLDELGIRQRTIVIFTTDNGTGKGVRGELHGKPMSGGKATLWERGVCQPFIANGPGMVKPGVQTDALVDFTDLMPTFVELAGGEIPMDKVLGGEIDGQSFAPLLLGKADDSPRDWIMAMGFGPARLDEQGVRPVKDYTDRIIRNKRFKLWVMDGEPAKLFDLKNDPLEQTNLIDSGDAETKKNLVALIEVMKTFPARDARPKYDPVPPQPWDRKRDQ